MQAIVNYKLCRNYSQLLKGQYIMCLNKRAREDDLGLNYLGTLLIGTAFKFTQRIKNSPSCVHVLRKT